MGGKYEQICERVFLVGGAGLSGPADCLVYALDLGEKVLIDCGAGESWEIIRENLRSAGIQPEEIHTLVLTHAHIDHIGAAAEIKRESGCRVVAHAADAPAIEAADRRYTVADLYGVDLEPVGVDHVVRGEGEGLSFGGGELRLLHTPGHTAGSLAALVELKGQRVLFGQDIHGPFSPVFASDLQAWRRSMRRLLALEADILCEGHFGVFRPAAEVRRFIEGHLSSPKQMLPGSG